MPYETVCGAKLYYETFGVKREGQTPVLLIHGSTQTGYSCWNKVAPELARDYFVIVPDCRGHGRSENPTRSYSFRELAADMAALIRALGFEKAHVVGHSNGGNVAIVMMMEHPDATQTCVAQAGNAWLSDALIERERLIFRPEYIAAHYPEWMKEAVALHEPFHGEGYASLLMDLTREELLREPNYTPQQLARVNLPVLFIQGEKDEVNAPSRFAQLMARAAPLSELWIPKNVAHNVHDETMNDWLETVRDFFSRRGNAESEALYRFRMAHYPDKRDGEFNVRVDARGKIVGAVLTPQRRQEALSVLNRAAPEDEIQVRIAESTPWAILNRPIEDLRSKPTIHSERISQARLSETARVIERVPGWAKIRLEHDGYIGWVHDNSLFICDASAAAQYLSTCNAVASASLAEAKNERGALTQKIPFGVRARLEGDQLILPDGRRWIVTPSDFLALDKTPPPTPEGIAQTLDLIRRFAGVPYLWGGRSPYGFDCSGLAGVFHAFMGANIPRDADQQFTSGREADTPEPGDLLFFGEPDEDGDAHISHVAISLGGDDFIHANGSDWGVSYNSLDPQSPIYRAWLGENYRGARRFV